jgi:hypothetical protein
MNRKIHRFVTEGISADVEWVISTRDYLEMQMTSDLRSRGYVRVYDLDTQLYTSFDARHDRFTWSIVMYAMYVGKRKAQEIQGVVNGQLVGKSPDVED